MLQCTSLYPCPPEKIGLNLIPFFRERYGCKVGLSDHSGTIFPGLAAAALGMDFLEVHITFSRETFGPDVASSVTAAEFRTLVDGVRFIERMVANPVGKEQLDPALVPLRSIFTKSVTVRADLPAGTVLTAQHLIARKPGTGIPAARIEQVIGRRLRSPVGAGHVLQEADLLGEQEHPPERG
jgi:N-acetylneuraminate synthase